MTTTTTPNLGPNAARRRPRFVDLERKTFAWPCPRRSVFSILVSYELHDVTVQLSGELDLAGVEAFDECVEAACADTPRRLVLELSALEFIDVVGINALLAALRRTDAAGVELVLDSPSPAVATLLGLTCPDGTFFVR